MIGSIPLLLPYDFMTRTRKNVLFKGLIFFTTVIVERKHFVNTSES